MSSQHCSHLPLNDFYLDYSSELSHVVFALNDSTINIILVLLFFIVCLFSCFWQYILRELLYYYCHYVITIVTIVICIIVNWVTKLGVISRHRCSADFCIQPQCPLARPIP